MSNCVVCEKEFTKNSNSQLTCNKKCSIKRNSSLPSAKLSTARFQKKYSYTLCLTQFSRVNWFQWPCCGKCNKIRNTFLTKEEMEVAMKAILEYRKANEEVSHRL